MLQAPLRVTHCVTLGKSFTVPGQGKPAGDAQGSSAQWGQAARAVASMWPTSGAGQLVARVGRVTKETGHHPSRGPGSVLNCLLREAELSAGGGWRGGNRTVALAPAPTPPPRAQVDGYWEGGGTGTRGRGPGGRQEWLRGGFDAAQRVTQRDEHNCSGACIADFWGRRPAAVLPCQTQAFTAGRGGQPPDATRLLPLLLPGLH